MLAIHWCASEPDSTAIRGSRLIIRTLLLRAAVVGLFFGSAGQLMAADSVVQANPISLNPGKSAFSQITLVAQGNENSISFSIDFDPGVLQFLETRLGAGAKGAALDVNTNEVSSGHAGFMVRLSPGQTIAAGSQVLVEVGFTALPDAAGKSSPLAFSDQPVARELSDTNGIGIGASFLDGQAAIRAPPVVSDLSDQMMGQDGSLSIAFTVTDPEIAATNLVITAESSNPLVVPNSGLIITGTDTNRVLSIRPAAGQSGKAIVKIIVSNGQLSSEKTFQLIVVPAIEIVSQPLDQSIVSGGTAQFEVSVRGTEPIQFQWHFQGVDIPGANQPALSITNVSPSNAGKYSVDVSDVTGIKKSREAVLTVNVLPIILRQPEGKMVLAGSDVTLEVAAKGTEPLAFQWQFESSDIAGAIKSSLHLTQLQGTNSGVYRVIVRNPAGETISQEATLFVVVPPNIVQQPEDVLAKAGETATFAVAAEGSDPMKFQWNFGGKPIKGATNANLVLFNVQGANDGFYSVVVTNSAGVARSSVARLTVSIPPVMVRPPLNQAVLAGDDAFIEVTVSGTEPLAYQWRFNGKDLAGADGPSLFLSNVQPTNAGTYSVVVTNFAGNVTSPTAALTVNVPVRINQPPVSQVAKAGDTVTFSVAATGSAPLKYQWFFGGVLLTNQTNPTLTFTNAQPSQEGSYVVAVSNVVGSEMSGEATLAVNVPVTIVLPPASQTTREGETVHFFARASGTAPLAYQWFFNGAPLAGETDANLTRAEVTVAQAGSYAVAVSNILGTVTSAPPAVLTVLAAPSAAKLPDVQTAAPGSSITFSNSPSGAGPFIFQWLRNGVNIPDATNSTLTLSNLRPSDSGSYSVAVEGPGGAVTSDPSLLVVLTQPFSFADNFAAKTILDPPAGSVMGGNTNATFEAGEPQHAAGHNPRHSVWFSWRAPADGIASFDTVGSGFDTVLAVYTGTNLNQLQRITRDEDSGGYLTSVVNFNAQAGRLYHFAIDSVSGATGHIVVNWQFEITAARLPEISTPPASQTALVNQSVTFSVVAQGDPPLAYQWFLDDQLIPGATSPVYRIASVQRRDAGAYTVRVTSGIGPNAVFVESAPAVLELDLIPTGEEGPGVVEHTKFSELLVGLARKPVALASSRPFQSVARGFTSAQIFSTKKAVKEPGEPNHCGVVGGASAWSLFQPSTNGTARISTEGSDFNTILAVYTGPGTDFASLVTVACDLHSGPDGKSSLVTFPVRAGTPYFVVVDGVQGARGVVELTLQLAERPSILQPPTLQLLSSPLRLDAIRPAALSTVRLGAAVQMSILATNRLADTSLSFQWKRNGIDLPGATNAILLLRNAQVSDSGSYTVDVSNFAGITTSPPLSIAVSVPPSIVSPPQDFTAAAGASAIFSAVAGGSEPLSFQWQFNGMNLPGATKSTFVITNVQPLHSGIYAVLVQNPSGNSRAQAILSVLGVPTIVDQPQSQAVASGAGVAFRVTAVSTSPLTYQWRFKGVNIPGATDPVLILDPIGPSNAGRYTVLVANSLRSIESQPATLSVNVPIVSEPVKILKGTLAADGTFHLRVSGPIGGAFKLQSSTNLVTWADRTNITFAAGIMEVDAPAAAPSRLQFYRLFSPQK